MENLTQIRIELGINAQKLIQQVQINNETIEKQLERGIQQALDEIMINDQFVDIVKEATKKELINLTHKALMSWELKDRIEKSIREKIDAKIGTYTDKIAEKLVKALEK